VVDTPPPPYLDHGLLPPAMVYFGHQPFNTDIPYTINSAVISPYAGEGFMYQFVYDALFEYQTQDEN